MDWTGMQYLKEVLEKQCEIAEVDFNKVNFDSETWFQDVTWTKEQETTFEEWVKDYMKTNSKARNQLMTVKSKSKKTIDKWWAMYNLMYGFRVIDDE